MPTELNKCMGTSAPRKTIVHNGVEYTFAPAYSHLSLSKIEEALFARKVGALRELKDLYTPEQMLAEGRALLEQRDRGEFGFASEASAEFFKRPEGALLLLSVLCGYGEDVLLELLATRTEEMQEIIGEVVAASFAPPKPQQEGRPSPKAPRRQSRGS